MATITYTLPRPTPETGFMYGLHIPSGVLARGDVCHVKAGHFRGEPQAWKLKAGRINLTTSAEVANRYIEFAYYGASGELYNLFYSPACAASATIALQLGTAGAPGGSASYGETGGYINLGDGFIIEGDQSIRACISINQNGDAWGVNLMFENVNRSVQEWRKLLTR